MKQKRIRANLAIAGLDEGLAIACAGIHEAHCQRLLPALATESCGTLAGEQQYLLEHGFVQWSSAKCDKKHCSHTALIQQQLVTRSAPLGLVTASAPPSTKTMKDVKQGIRHWHHSFICNKIAST